MPLPLGKQRAPCAEESDPARLAFAAHAARRAVPFLIRCSTVRFCVLRPLYFESLPLRRRPSTRVARVVRRVDCQSFAAGVPPDTK